MQLLARCAGIGALILSLGFGASPSSADPCSTVRRLPLSFSIQPARPCDGDSIALAVSACGPCVDLISTSTDPRLEVVARMDARQCLLRACNRETMTIGLGRLAAGNHLLRIGVSGEVVGEDGASCTVAYDDSLEFSVGRCVSPELPFVDDIVVGQRVVCVTWPCPDLACPNDSIPVLVRGTFPDDCHTLRRIELLPSIATVIGPPTLRILIDDGGCLGRPCTLRPVPWSAKLLLPPLPPGNYRLPVKLAVATCTDSFPEDGVHVAGADFRVVAPGTPGCPTERHCFRVAWSGKDRVVDDSARVAACDAVVFPGHEGRVVMSVAPTVPLAGLQGDLVLDPPGLRIAHLAPTGPAAGMRLHWRATERGARFVLFADHGAPIPAYRLQDMGGWPVLVVTVEQPPGAPARERTLLVATNLIASDSTGQGVDECPRPPGPGPRALICSDSRCDLNADGRADVRDLVLMVRCILGAGRSGAASAAGRPEPACPDPAALDCDGNGEAQIEDVLCCARLILRGPMADPIGRPEPGIRIELGDVRRSGELYELPIVLRGAGRMGAARVALSYPADRFEVAAMDVAAGADWLGLHEVRDGQVVIGVISTSAASGEEDAELRMALRLALKPGQSAAGEVRVVEGEFSGRDGAGLVVDLGAPAQSLGGGLGLALSPAEPNPFSGVTRFSVALSPATALEVDVYDLGGRRVSNLFRGSAPAGRHDLVWDGRRGDGSAAASGVYFLRAAAGGRVVSRRIVLLRER